LVAGIVLLACLLAGCGTTSGSTQPKDASSAQRSDVSSQSASPAVFDLGRDFSFTANPNGPWRYGFTRGTQLNLAAFVPDATSVATSPVGFWHAGPASAGYYPYIAANTSSSTVWDPTHSWPVRAHEVALEASASGQFAVVEFIVPRAGSYEIAADFAGVHKHLSTTDAHVLLNDDSLFSATILGYGGDPAFLPRQGASPTASFHATRALRAGDVLSFAIGYGPNHTHFDDTTGLILTIRAVS
jgi:hypothetical protein